MKLTQRLIALPILVAATAAAAEPSIISSHEIRFRQITFTCGVVEDQGTQRRFLLSAPYRIDLPLYEPLQGDLESARWQVVYRTICEKQRPRFAVAR